MMNIAELPKYDVYKDSGNEWLGVIPKDWAFKKFKYLARVKKGKIPKRIVSVDSFNLPPYLSMDYLRGTNAKQFVDDRNAVLVEDGAILLLWDGSNAGEFVLGKWGVVSSTLANVDFFSVNKKFAWYACQLTEMELRSTTVGMGIPHVDGEQLKNSILAIPSPNEQVLIANFLDKKTAKIDDAIAIKEQQICLLKERKQIIIQQAVSQGLNPNVPMKDSGVDWVGKIPQHWELVKLGSCLSSVSVKNHPELPLLSITREQGVIKRDVDDQESNHNFIPDDLSGYKKLEKGQFGMNKMKAWQGSYGVSKFTGIVSPAYYVFDFNNQINHNFFNWAIRSKLYVSFFFSASDGVRIGQWDLSKARMKVIPFVLPSEEEQLLIATYLDKKLEQVDAAIKIKLQQIEKLKEYKTTLINSAVTGKIKITPEMVEQ